MFDRSSTIQNDKYFIKLHDLIKRQIKVPQGLADSKS